MNIEEHILKTTGYVPLVSVKTANECLAESRNRPNPTMLFDNFWQEGELCILFADTNAGKSILAVQIADSISCGRAVPGFRLEAAAQRVLYFDFEMTLKQFENRYSYNYNEHYNFCDNFFRVELNPDAQVIRSFEDELYGAIEHAITAYSATVLIVDNITYLKTQSTDTANEALPLMKHLKDLKLKHGLSVLALAHTRKKNLCEPITKNDITGSKHLANFADSIFCIGESHRETDLRYFKQIKARATEILYSTENVALCRITKPYNFLGFEYVSTTNERDHLKPRSEKESAELETAILDMKRNEPGLSYREIARRLNTNHNKVRRLLDRN